MSPRKALPPPDADDLPEVPPDIGVTAWGVTLPPGWRGMSPRQVAVLLLNVSWLRWQEYAALLEAQKNAGRPGPAGGLVGFRMGRAPDGTMYPTSEEIRALAKLEGDERDRAARLAMQCHEQGITGEEWAS